MYTELFKKNSSNILKYLQKLGKKSKIYSECRHGIGPLYPDTETYVYATEEEIILILIDANAAPISDEKDEMAWDLALTCELFRNRFMRLSKHVPNIYGVLLTSDHVIDQDQMQPVWDTLDIKVIGEVEDLDILSLPVNTDSNLSIAFPLIFLYEAEFTEADYAYAEYSLISLVDPDISKDERDEEMNYLLEEFGLADYMSNED